MGHFKNGTVYQIYTKSFQDTAGNGLSDMRGVMNRLDYLEGLGIDHIWLTPFFSSPFSDNGYDVADYQAASPMLGTMKSVEGLIRGTGIGGMGCVFDMVFNHTSTKHPWLKKAFEGNSGYTDYYISGEGSPDAPPTNWQPKLGENAWEHIPRLKKQCLHLFDVTRADLNWDNLRVRQGLKEIILFWKIKGVKGFRFDMVNLIPRSGIFENDHKGDGHRFYTDGPRVYEHLQELVQGIGIEDMVIVGKMSSITLDSCIRYSRSEDRELSMCFSFHRLKMDYRDGDKWKLMGPDLARLKQLFME